jgi:alkyl sulfatase BDS1-like metallo-beta-lactamase superfamily hydrolase
LSAAFTIDGKPRTVLCFIAEDMMRPGTDLSRLRQHKLRAKALMAGSPEGALKLLRVMLDPDRALGVDRHIVFCFEDGSVFGLHVRNCVSVVTDGAHAQTVVKLSWQSLTEVLTASTTIEQLVTAALAQVSGAPDAVEQAMACFDLA